MRAKSKKQKAKGSAKPEMTIGRKLANAMKQLRKATAKALKADPAFDRIFRRLERAR